MACARRLSSARCSWFMAARAMGCATSASTANDTAKLRGQRRKKCSMGSSDTCRAAQDAFAEVLRYFRIGE